MKFVWDEDAWADCEWWQTQDRKILKRINTLLRDIARNGNEGIGKPEPLEHDSPDTGRGASTKSTGWSTKSPVRRRGSRLAGTTTAGVCRIWLRDHLWTRPRWVRPRWLRSSDH